MSIPRPLYHFTCSHGAPRIRRMGLVMPMRPAWKGPRVVWLTDLAEADVPGLGLTSTVLDCDRSEYRFVIPDPDVMPWETGRGLVPDEWAHALEQAPGARPDRWFIGIRPQRIEKS